MAMEASINLVAYSLAQSMILQGIKGVGISLDSITFTSDDDTQEQQLPLLPQQQQQAGPSGYMPIGKVMTIGGRVLSLNFIVKNKMLGRESGKSSNTNCIKVFHKLESEGFGGMACEDTFAFVDDVEQKVTSTDTMKNFLTSHGVSLPKFFNSLQKETKMCQPTAKRVKKQPLKDSSNIPE